MGRWLLEPDQPILLVLDSDTKVEEIVKYFLCTGYSNFAGYLAGGMTSWDNAGFELDEVDQMTVHEVKKADTTLQVVDVRAPSEWEEGHVPGAIHMFLPDLRKKSAQTDKSLTCRGVLRQWLPCKYWDQISQAGGV